MIRFAPGLSATRRARFAWLTLVPLALLLAAAVALYLLVLGQAGASHQDFDTYLAAGKDLLQGRPLYDGFLHHPFPDPTLRPAYIYPPVFAVLFSPLALMPPAIAWWVWLLMMQAALIATAVVFARALNISGSPAVLIAVATLAFFPLWVDAVQGQANLLILLLLGAGMVGVASGRVSAAFAIGVAGAIKLTPLLLLGWLFWERRFRALGWALLGFAAATLAGAAVRYQDTVTFFTKVAPALAQGTAFYGNQSISGFTARVFTANPYTQPWVILSFEPLLVFLLSIAALAWWIWQSGRLAEPLSRAMLFLLLLPLLSSITWVHHLVIVLPVIWLLMARLASRGWPIPQTVTLATALACYSLLSRVSLGPAFQEPGFMAAQTTNPLVVLTANSVLLGSLILFLAGPWLLRSR